VLTYRLAAPEEFHDFFQFELSFLILQKPAAGRDGEARGRRESG